MHLFFRVNILFYKFYCFSVIYVSFPLRLRDSMTLMYVTSVYKDNAYDKIGKTHFDFI